MLNLKALSTGKRLLIWFYCKSRLYSPKRAQKEINLNEHRTEHFANFGHDFGSNMGKAIQESIEHQIDVLTESDWFQEKLNKAVENALKARGGKWN